MPHVALCGYQNTDIEVTSKGGKQDLAVYNRPGTGIWERGNGEVFVRDEDRYSCKICSTKVYTDLHQLGCSAVFPSCLAITDSKGQLDPRFRPSAHIFYPSGFLDSFDELPKLQGFPPAFGGTDGRLFRNDYHNGFKKWPWKEAYGTSVVAVLSLIGLFSTPNWEPILSWIGAGAEWREMPWRSWMDPSEQWERLPSFLILEYWYFVLALICLAHARLNGALDLWFAGWFCGTANDVICMYLPLIDNFWQAQATVMLTPRLPLYIVAMYVCLMYPANTAAMRFGFRWSLAEAMCAALFASLWYGVYDVCGPRLLWWTWHDSDVAIAERLGNAPIGSTMWIWTYTFIFNLSYRWATRGGTGEWTTLIESAASLVRKHGEPYIGITMTYQARSMLRSIGAFFEKKQQFFRYRSVELTIFVVAIICVPVFMVLLGQFSIFSLDIAGRPGIRTMVLCGTTFTCTVICCLFRSVRALRPLSVGSIKKVATMLRPVPISWVAPAPGDRILGLALVSHYVILAMLLLFSDPTQHLSTGVHQKFFTCEFKAYDIMFFSRNDFLCRNETVFGPFDYSKNDYQVTDSCGAELEERLRRKGVAPNNPVMVSDSNGKQRNYDLAASLVPSMQLDPDWYTVCGTKEPDYKGNEHSATAMLSTKVFMRQSFLGLIGILASSCIFFRYSRQP